MRSYLGQNQPDFNFSDFLSDKQTGTVLPGLPEGVRKHCLARVCLEIDTAFSRCYNDPATHEHASSGGVMKIRRKYLLGLFIGSACAALPVVLSRILVRNLAAIFGRVGSLLSLDKETLARGTQILSQLKTAAIVSPWLLFLLAGAVLGALAAWVFDRRKARHIVLDLALCLLLLLLLTLIALWLTSINEIFVGSLIRSVLPTLSHLL
jgi:hypothetical protein